MQIDSPTIRKIAVFCGSSCGNDNKIAQDCIRLASFMSDNQITLVYGGGNVGLMGVLADKMLASGGKVIGVIPEKLVEIEVAHNGLTQLHIVPGMHERKALMTSLADAFLVLPGGIGTMEEFFEIYTWLQLGYHNKPVGICNVNGFYNGLIDFLNKLAEQGFVSREQIEKLMISDNSVELAIKILT